MENEKNYHDRIDSYLRNELTEEDRVLFEEALQNNAELKEEYLIHLELLAQVDDSRWISEAFDPNPEQVKAIKEYYRSEEAKDFKKIIQKSKNDYNNTQPKDKTRWLLPIIAAASLVFILLLQFNFFSKSNLDLYSEYAQWNDLPSLTSRSNGTELSEAQLLFEQKKYRESFEIFSNYSQNNTELSSSILIYLGLNALELNKYDEAIQNFDMLIASDAIDQSMGYWYKMLVYLKLNDINEVKTILEIIIQDKNNYKYHEAKDLLSEIN